MTNPYGWSVIPRFLVKKERWPGFVQVRSIPLVYPGQEVLPDQPVLRGELLPRKKSATLQRSNSSLQNSIASSSGEVGGEQGTLHSSSAMPVDSSFPTNPSRSVNSSSPSIASSQVAAMTSSQIAEVPAGLHGRVVGFTGRGGVVIESKVALIQGALGVGNQVAGVLTMWRAGGVGYVPRAIPPGALLVVPGSLSFSLVHRALASGVNGIIAGSMALHDLEGFLRADFLQLLQHEDIELAQSQFPSLTILLTEGIGSAAMSARVLNLLHHYEGSIALLSGTTSLRYNIYPDLLVSLPLAETQENWQPIWPDPALALDVPVRICSGVRRGVVGTIDYFFVYPQLFRSGIRMPAARLRLPDGTFLVVPCSLLERAG